MPEEKPDPIEQESQQYLMDEMARLHQLAAHRKRERLPSPEPTTPEKPELASHPRIHVHFTPTSASWLNMVERFFRDITTERLRNGVFRSVPELTTAIKEYIQLHNKNPKPFVWTSKANDILAKVIRANSRLSSKKNEALH